MPRPHPHPNTLPPRAVVVRPDRPDTAYFFEGSAKRLTGRAGDWNQLANVLSGRIQGKTDHMHPPGAMVGAFAYDGSFVFYDYPQLRVGRCQDLWPDAIGPWDAGEQDWVTDTPREQYAAKVLRAQEHIRLGDVYQVNLTRRFHKNQRVGDPFGLFRHLWSVSEAPLSAYLELPDGALCSASPELFLRIDGNRVTTRPIKGTRPRDRDVQRDSQNAYDLLSSPKEQAELVMITDLERNDLGMICEYGSVVVEELVKREGYSHVHHLVSTVSGMLRREVGLLAAVQACFPGGSITGAPKKRAMEIITALESRPRGWYTGAIGYFGYDGTAQFNIAIRTLVVEGDRVHFHTGSGITADSDPYLEFEETNHKAAAMRQAFAQYCASPRYNNSLTGC